MSEVIIVIHKQCLFNTFINSFSTVNIPKATYKMEMLV